MVKKKLILMGVFLLFGLAISAQGYAEELPEGVTLEKYLEMYKKVAIEDPAYVTQIENERKQHGISAREVQVSNLYYMKFMQFKTWDVAFGRLPLLREDGQVRERVVTRQQMTMPAESGIEVKGNFNFLSPNEVRGMKALMITYYDPKKESDYWMYVPSLRKIRRISAADRDDSFFGSDATWADAADIKVDEEKHSMLKEAAYPTQWDTKIYDEPNTAAWEHVFDPGCAGKLGRPALAAEFLDAILAAKSGLDADLRGRFACDRISVLRGISRSAVPNSPWTQDAWRSSASPVGSAALAE